MAEDFYVGTVITIFSRCIKITGYADACTKTKLETQLQKVFVLLKPDVIDKISDILKAIINYDFYIINIKMIRLIPNDITECCLVKDEMEKTCIINYLISGPVVALELLGGNGTMRWQELAGPEDSKHARSTAASSLRACYGKDEIHNAVYGSKDTETAMQISESIALVGEKEPLKSLEQEYAEDDVYLSKAKVLAQKYSYIRRTRPDGNCFFRAFSYAYLEKLIGNKEEYDKFRDLALKSKDSLVALGFPQFTVEDFHDTFMEVIDKVGGDTESSHMELHKLFNEQGYSDYVVVYLRLITSGQLQRDADFYQHFIEGERTISEFCHQEVEPMYKESDHIHIIAMSSALGTGVRVRYMDRGAGTEVTAHDFPEGAIPAVHLLYRPGHYDILYP